MFTFRIFKELLLTPWGRMRICLRLNIELILPLQACRVTGKNSYPCEEKKIAGTDVIEVTMDTGREKVLVCDCVGILKVWRIMYIDFLTNWNLLKTDFFLQSVPKITMWSRLRNYFSWGINRKYFLKIHFIWCLNGFIPALCYCFFSCFTKLKFVQGWKRNSEFYWPQILSFVRVRTLRIRPGWLWF